MKSFEEYKNGIDTVTESMKTELLDVVNEIDFTSFHSIKESLQKNKKFSSFESVFPPSIDCYFEFENQNVTLKYNDDNKTIIVTDLDDIYNYIEVQADMSLLKYVAAKYGELDMRNQPVIRSEILNLEIEKLILEQSKSFSSVLVYNSVLSIDNTIESNVFFIIDQQNIIVEGVIHFDENENMDIIKMDIYNVKSKEFKLISRYTTKKLNVTGIKYIFENLKPVSMGDSLTSVIQEKGFEYFDTEEFKTMLEFKVLL